MSDEPIALAKPKPERILWIDIAKGLAMFLVCFGHEGVDKQVEGWIYSFHMPLFFMLSGMTFSFNKETRIWPYLLKKIKSLLIPYFLLNIMVYPICLWGMAVGRDPVVPFWSPIVGIFLSQKRSGYPIPSNTTWFIATLFLADVLFFLIWKLVQHDLGILIVTPLLTALIYTTYSLEHPGGGIWHWESAFTAIEFYMVGYLFLKYFPYIKRWANDVLIELLVVIFGFGIGYLFFDYNSRVSLIADSYGNLFFFYACALLHSAAFLALVMLICQSAPVRKIFSFANYIGKNTMPYIAFQVPVMRMLKFYIPFFGAPTQLGRFLMCLLFYFAFMPFAGLITKILPGRKKK